MNQRLDADRRDRLSDATKEGFMARRVDKATAIRAADVIITPYGVERRRRRAKWLTRELDYELDKLKGAKRFGAAWLSLAAMAVSLVLAPAFVVWRTSELGPIGTPALVGAAARETRLSQRPAPMDAIDPDVQRALIAANDPDFCYNGAVLRRLTAEQAFLWKEADPLSPSPVRGLLADYLAGMINLFWDKQKTLTVFANTADWGAGLIGVEAAAQARLGQSAAEMDLTNAAIPLVIGRVNPDLLRNAAQSVMLRQMVGVMSTQIIALEQAQAFYCLPPPQVGAPPPVPQTQGRGTTRRP